MPTDKSDSRWVALKCLLSGYWREAERDLFGLFLKFFKTSKQMLDL